MKNKTLPVNGLYIYKDEIFDENRKCECGCDGTRPKSVGMIGSFDCIDHEDELFLIDEEYSRVDALMILWDFLKSSGIDHTDECYGDFIDYAIRKETCEHQQRRMTRR